MFLVSLLRRRFVSPSICGYRKTLLKGTEMCSDKHTMSGVYRFTPRDVEASTPHFV